MEKKPLISVVIACYNAEKFIEETLNSVYKQTYEKIEIVISDDHSNDSTVQLVYKWIESHRERFFNVIIITSEKNTGVAVNFDRATRRATGEWIKIMGGDDLLPPQALSNYIAYVEKQDIRTILCAKSASFKESNGHIKITDVKPDPYTKYVFGLPAKEQYHKMLYEYVILIPVSMFISKELYEKVGYYDTTFPYIDDQPLFLKLTYEGVKIHFCDGFIGYMHRTSIDSISQTTCGLMNKRAFGYKGLLHEQDITYVLPNIPKWHVIFYYHYYLDLFRRILLVNILKNKNNIITRFLNRFLLFLDPVFMKKKIFNYLNLEKNDETLYTEDIFDN